MSAEAVVPVLIGILAAIVLVPLALLILFFLWPLLLCWWLGSPVIGVLAEVIWLCAMR